MHDDKIFSNFAQAGVPLFTSLELQTQTIGAVEFHIVTFNGNFLSPFVLSYDIAVDLTMHPLRRIVRVSGDLSNPTRLGGPNVIKDIYRSGGPFIGSVSSFMLNPGTPLALNETAVHVNDTYLPGGGAAVSISNTFAQADVPEVASLWLMGLGLALVARLKRRRPER
jgi:hypothetical protein